jgi:peroxiredoxin
VKLYEEYEEKGFVIIGVAEQSPAKDIEKFVTSYEVPYPIGRDEDGSAAAQYGVRAIPTSFLFTREGKIHHKFMGYTSEEFLKNKLQELLG